MEFLSLIKYSYAWNTFHYVYLAYAKDVNISLHSFAKSVNNAT